MALYSLGANCLPKLGIDGYAGTAHSYFFDWLISDIQSLETSLLLFSENRFLREGYELVEHGLQVYDNHTGLRFQHDFPVAADGKVDILKIEQSLDKVRETYIRRRDRLLHSIVHDAYPTLVRYDFVVGNGLKASEDNYGRRVGNIVDAWIGKAFRLVIMSQDITETRRSGNTIFYRIETEKEKPWCAKKESWQRVMSLLEL